jgi:hypothetical protein
MSSVISLMSIIVVAGGVKGHHPPSKIKTRLETLLGVTFSDAIYGK